MLSDIQLEEIIQNKSDKKKLASQLGFFSKPLLVKDYQGVEFVVKLYRPVKSEKTSNFLIENHEAYTKAMDNIGIRIPDTKILSKNIRGKHQLIIIQKAFSAAELVREQMETAPEQRVLDLLKLLLDDIMKFWMNKPAALQIGFHPTTRNYALRDEQLYYFDTFPPMLMPQKTLNELIITMAPVKFMIRGLVPQSAINRVSDEYYNADRMITGIIGSSCRLRPEMYNSILNFCKEYIAINTILNTDERNRILENISNPPQLSGIWVGFRKLFGMTGKPNLK